MFLSSLWLHSVFVCPKTATALGVSYLFLRSLYPILWATLGGEAGPPMAMSLGCTFPQYAINLYLTGTTVLKLAFGVTMDSYFGGLPPLAGNFLGVFVTNIAFMAYALGVVGGAQEPIFSKFFAGKKSD